MQKRGGAKSSAKSKASSSRCKPDERDPKRFKSTILYFMQRDGGKAQADPAADSSRESSESPGALPSQTPALPLVPGLQHPQAGLPTFPTGGVKVQTGLLQSLQRRFVQQALQTPAGQAGLGAAAHSGKQQQLHQQQEDEEADVEDMDGFILHSQPTYERPLSQRYPDSSQDVLPSAGSTEDTQMHFDFGTERSQQDGGRASQQQVQQQQQQPARVQQAAGQQAQALDPEELRRRLSNASACSQRTTPGMLPEDRTAAACATGLSSSAKLFPIFRSRSDMKQLYIIRHGESEYNAESSKASAQGGKWADPWIFDAPLTHKGRAQACALREKLAALGLPPDTLWVTSPLQRSIQTLLLCCPVAHKLLPSSSVASSAASSAGENAAPNGEDSTGASCTAPCPPLVCVRREISERVFTTGDIGHPPSVLCERFPQLAPELEQLPEAWWYTRPGKVNCALQQKFEQSEPADHVYCRIGEFKKWLLARPEKVVVAVGHSSYWAAFWKQHTGSKPERMANCQLLGPIWV